MGLDGKSDQLAWLEHTFGAPEEDLALWSIITWHGSVDVHDCYCDEQMLAFLPNRNEPASFLHGLLGKYGAQAVHGCEITTQVLFGRKKSTMTKGGRTTPDTCGRVDIIRLEITTLFANDHRNLLE